jgi:hypothetical protein
MRAFLISWLLAGSLAPAAFAAPAAPEERPSLRVKRAAGPIKVDGILGDPGWQGAAETATFYEVSPGDNIPSPVKTTAWITYDDKYFYLALRCDDPDPSKIRAPFTERDNVSSDQDFAGVFLDARDDRRSALELFVNPRGIQSDLVYSDATGNEDASPDFFWDAAARITPHGWEMEMRVPFASLRYSKGDPQTWGLIFFRNYPRDYRYQIASVITPRGSNCLLCHEMEISGLAGLPSAGHIVVAPYGTAKEVGEAREGPGTSFVNRPFDFDGGLDVKWTPNADNALDATVNPVFSQVESDVAQISANQRFALFYPEKRPFFMEGVDLLQTPYQAVYTRTITSPRWGLRATGQFSGTDYAVLTAQDRGGGTVIIPGPQASEFAPQDFSSMASIVRFRRSFGGSFVGFLITDRENDGGSYNRVIGPDFQWNPSDRDRITGQFLYSSTLTPNRPDLSLLWTGQKLSASAFYFAWNHSTKAWNMQTSYQDVGAGFRADDGFVPQVDFRALKQWAALDYYPTGFFSRVEPYVNLSQAWERGGGTLTSRWAAGTNFDGKRNLFGDMAAVTWAQRVGTKLLHYQNGNFTFRWSPNPHLSSVSIVGELGQEPDYANAGVGHGGSLTVGLTARATDHLTLQFNGQGAWLDASIPGHSGRQYTAEALRLKAVYTLSAQAFLRAIAQWTSTHSNPALYPYAVPEWQGGFSGSVLFGYRLNWQSVLFVGYGDNRILSDQGQLLKTDRQVFIKVSYAFQK